MNLTQLRTAVGWPALVRVVLLVLPACLLAEYLSIERFLPAGLGDLG